MLRYYFSPLFCAAAILFLSIIPSHELPDFSFWKLFTFDKIVHVAMYGILSFHILRACIRQHAVWSIQYYAVTIAATTSILYGALIELLQEYMIADRYGDWMDLVANMIGAFLGILIFKKLFIQYIR